MIEKLELIKAFNCSDTPQAKMQHHSYHNDCIKKINELVDVVNELQSAKDVMFNRIDRLNDAICDIRNRITTLDDPTYHEAPAKNVLTKSLRMDKEFAEDECVRLQNELHRTRKALDVAVDALKQIKDGKIPVSLGIYMDINDALEQITALEQKDK